MVAAKLGDNDLRRVQHVMMKHALRGATSERVLACIRQSVFPSLDVLSKKEFANVVKAAIKLVKNRH